MDYSAHQKIDAHDHRSGITEHGRAIITFLGLSTFHLELQVYPRRLKHSLANIFELTSRFWPPRGRYKSQASCRVLNTVMLHRNIKSGSLGRTEADNLWVNFLRF